MKGFTLNQKTMYWFFFVCYWWMCLTPENHKKSALKDVSTNSGCDAFWNSVLAVFFFAVSPLLFLGSVAGTIIIFLMEMIIKIIVSILFFIIDLFPRSKSKPIKIKPLDRLHEWLNNQNDLIQAIFVVLGLASIGGLFFALDWWYGLFDMPTWIGALFVIIGKFFIVGAITVVLSGILYLLIVGIKKTGLPQFISMVKGKLCPRIEWRNKIEKELHS